MCWRMFFKVQGSRFKVHLLSTVLINGIVTQRSIQRIHLYCLDLKRWMETSKYKHCSGIHCRSRAWRQRSYYGSLTTVNAFNANIKLTTVGIGCRPSSSWHRLSKWDGLDLAPPSGDFARGYRQDWQGHIKHPATETDHFTIRLEEFNIKDNPDPQENYQSYSSFVSLYFSLLSFWLVSFMSPTDW